MNGILSHVRNKFLAGILAAIPVVIIGYLIYWLESHTRDLTKPLGFTFPGLGFLLVLVGVYLLGVLVTSVIGRLLLRLLDRVLSKVPGLNMLFRAWKDVLVVSPEKSGMYHQAVLVPLDGERAQLGFTSGRTLPDDAERICVFMPDIPNPFAGRLVVVRKAACTELNMSVEDALKFQLSSGNYLPGGLSSSPSTKTPA